MFRINPKKNIFLLVPDTKYEIKLNNLFIRKKLHYAYDKFISHYYNYPYRSIVKMRWKIFDMEISCRVGNLLKSKFNIFFIFLIYFLIIFKLKKFIRILLLHEFKE